MDEETVRIVTDERTKEGTCFLSMGWGHGTIIESREQALGVAKALIDHYNIKQEELYPWIACSDRMPADKKPNGEDNWVWVGKESTAHFHPLLVLMLRKPSGQWYRRVGVELKPIHKAMIPTHWHPIPTL